MKGLSDEEIPLAERRLVRGRFVMSSPMWLVTLACAVLALGLTWSAMDSPGVKVTIHFVEGHGLEPGDAVRYRGIDVGRVDDIALGVGLAGVVVEIDLDEDAEGLAREGSRFWIVRPEIDLTGVSGLDTAVGAKYVAVLPGSSEERQAEFEGLPAQPPDSLGASGVEIVLRGDDRFGLNPGSPVTWRGVEVGQVLSSSISADALHVDTRVRIRKPHDRLLSRESKFWTTSGVQLDVGVTGVELSADTLDEIARGGVAFITPGGAPGADDEIRAGEVFTLHPRPRSAWIDDSEPMPLLRADPPSIVSVASRWQQKYFGLTRNRETVASGIPVRVDREVKVLLPADLLAAFEHAIDQTGTLA
ncbi:MAG: MlaD family protein, partial [Pseudomonadota bacterium]